MDRWSDGWMLEKGKEDASEAAAVTGPPSDEHQLLDHCCNTNRFRHIQFRRFQYIQWHRTSRPFFGRGRRESRFLEHD